MLFKVLYSHLRKRACDLHVHVSKEVTQVHEDAFRFADCQEPPTPATRAKAVPVTPGPSTRSWGVLTTAGGADMDTDTRLLQGTVLGDTHTPGSSGQRIPPEGTWEAEPQEAQRRSPGWVRGCKHVELAEVPSKGDRGSHRQEAMVRAVKRGSEQEAMGCSEAHIRGNPDTGCERGGNAVCLKYKSKCWF